MVVWATSSPAWGASASNMVGAHLGRRHQLLLLLVSLMSMTPVEGMVTSLCNVMRKIIVLVCNMIAVVPIHVVTILLYNMTMDVVIAISID